MIEWDKTIGIGLTALFIFYIFGIPFLVWLVTPASVCIKNGYTESISIAVTNSEVKHIDDVEYVRCCKDIIIDDDFAEQCEIFEVK